MTNIIVIIFDTLSISSEKLRSKAEKRNIKSFVVSIFMLLQYPCIDNSKGNGSVDGFATEKQAKYLGLELKSYFWLLQI